MRLAQPLSASKGVLRQVAVPRALRVLEDQVVHLHQPYALGVHHHQQQTRGISPGGSELHGLAGHGLVGRGHHHQSPVSLELRRHRRNMRGLNQRDLHA